MLIFPSLCLSQKMPFGTTLKATRLSDKDFVYDIALSTHPGWKFAKPPSLSVSKTGHFESFRETTKKINDSSYDIRLKTSIDTSKYEKNSVLIHIDCFVCKDICMVVSKEIKLRFDCDQKIGESVVFYDDDDSNEVSTPSKNKKSNHSFFFIIIFSIIGGFILNIMPCVLPVLLLKLRAFTEAHKKTAILGSIAGNYATFAVFGISIAFLKIFGESIGWGMHFQNVLFLKFAAIALFLFSLYSFEIIRFTPSVELGEKQRSTFFKSFFSSIIASAMAIPCTAPFLGTAATFAIQGSIFDLFSVFSGIATGFSIPYFAAILMPELHISKKLSIYSGLVKKIINSGIIIIFAWVVFLLFKQVSAFVCAIYVAIFSASFFLFIRKIPILAFFMLFCAFVVDVKYGNSNIANVKRNNGVWIISEDMDSIRNTISKAVSDNRVVILSISADWCLTCKYNKVRLLDRQQVSDIIKNKNILCIEGDMTRASSSNAMMEFIKKHNRVGIPFLMVYGPCAKNGILLSELPSFVDLVSAINKAEDNSQTDLP